MTKIFHFDAGKLCEGSGEILRLIAVRDLDGELVHRPSAVPLKNVDA
jgi:hypothetical protein